MATAAAGAATRNSWAWVGELKTSLGIYAVIFASGAVVVTVVRKSGYVRESGLGQFLVTDGLADAAAAGRKSKLGAGGTSKLLFATAGLYATLISQGVVLEKLMTTPYAGGSFTASGFAILGSRCVPGREQKILQAPWSNC
eukprot:SAG22_NODE_664_length_8022_cov_2.639576_6_plen_141_part_00